MERDDQKRGVLDPFVATGYAGAIRAAVGRSTEATALASGCFSAFADVQRAGCLSVFADAQRAALEAQAATWGIRDQLTATMAMGEAFRREVGATGVIAKLASDALAQPRGATEYVPGGLDSVDRWRTLLELPPIPAAIHLRRRESEELRQLKAEQQQLRAEFERLKALLSPPPPPEDNTDSGRPSGQYL